MWFSASLLFGVSKIRSMKTGNRLGRLLLMSPNKDKTGNDRQRRRREREKVWLKEHGFESWEALHTSLMNGETSLTQRPPDWLYCPYCGELMSDHLITERGGYCKPASR
jgi:hypothetical protein